MKNMLKRALLETASETSVNRTLPVLSNGEYGRTVDIAGIELGLMGMVYSASRRRTIFTQLPSGFYQNAKDLK